jgi:AcrR family transcriptional regulator
MVCANCSENLPSTLRPGAGSTIAHLRKILHDEDRRRVQRTRELLQKALIELISERGSEAITIQNIVDRTNVGRTSFYLHYNSTDELFMSCHEAIVGNFHFGPLHPLSREELLSSEAPPGIALCISAS